MITVGDIHKSYGKKDSLYEALRGVSLTIGQGESVAIVGKSGSGKSTLMHLLAGLDHPTTGTISWQGQTLESMNEHQRADLRNQQVGFIFQQFFLQPTMTVLENTVLPLQISGASASLCTTRGREVLRDVGLLEKANNRATDLC
jgi:putative ABC transport system ATP-binding protein